MKIHRNTVKFGYKDSFHYSTLEQIIHNWLKNFKEVLEKRNAEGKCLVVPNSISGHDKDDYSEESVNHGFQEWMNMLDEMITAFSPDWEDWDSPFFAEACENNRKTLELRRKGRALFAENFENLWW